MGTIFYFLEIKRFREHLKLPSMYVCVSTNVCKLTYKYIYVHMCMCVCVCVCVCVRVFCKSSFFGDVNSNNGYLVLCQN